MIGKADSLHGSVRNHIESFEVNSKTVFARPRIASALCIL